MKIPGTALNLVMGPGRHRPPGLLTHQLGRGKLGQDTNSAAPLPEGHLHRWIGSIEALRVVTRASAQSLPTDWVQA